MYSNNILNFQESAHTKKVRKLIVCPREFSFYKNSFFRQYEPINQFIGQLSRVFANGPGDLCSIPGRVIPKTLKMVLDTSLLNTQQYKVRIKGKVENPGKGVAPSPTPQRSSYRKGSLLVALDYGRQLYFFYLRTNKMLYTCKIQWLQILKSTYYIPLFFFPEFRCPKLRVRVIRI